MSYSRERREHFRGKYAPTDADASAKLAVAVFGEDTGLNGYTTVQEATRLAEILSLDGSSVVLDLGSGRGWPGTHLSRATGCRVVLSDLPLEPLQQARRYARARGVAERVSAVCADGTSLPFRASSFHAVTHADVLC